MTFTHQLTLSRTCEATAVLEVYALHTHGEYELVDGTCGRGKEGRRRVMCEGKVERGRRTKVRNEGRRAAAVKTYFTYDHVGIS